MLPSASGGFRAAPSSSPSASDRRIDALIDRALTRITPVSSSARLDAEVLLGFVLRQPRSSLIAHPERTVNAGQAARFRRLIERRAAGTPVAYLIGCREFHSLPLQVSPATLVPRPETELLVDSVLERLPADERAVVLDAGCGCGAVALAIKHHRPRCRVVAVECSAPALEVAVSNGARLGHHVEWIRSHWFNALADDQFDFIAANPPYVAADEEALLIGDLRHEPRLALDGGADGFESLRAIVDDAPRVLSIGGTLLLEHGNDQAGAVRTLLRLGGFRRVETHRDLAGHDRVTIGTVPDKKPGRQATQ